MLREGGQSKSVEVLLGLLNLVVVVVYTIADIEAYQMPLALLVLTLGAAGPVGIGEILSPPGAPPQLGAQRRRKRAAMSAVAILLLGALGNVTLHRIAEERGNRRAGAGHDTDQEPLDRLAADHWRGPHASCRPERGPW